MPKVIRKGRGAISLSDSKDFKAQGGEASIYVQGDTVFKIWHNPSQMPPPAKVDELQVLRGRKQFIIPQDLLLDAKTNKPVGVTMRYVDQAYVLCQLFPKAFRDRMKVTPEIVVSLVRQIQEGMMFAHDQGVLIVDLNEMNFLVDQKFKEALFIDTTTYQTKNFPPTALMESVRDRHTKGFSRETDYFAFAVVCFNLFVGIHPYRGKFPKIDMAVPKDQRMDARMQQNVSVFHSGVSLPGACLPFDVIPPVYQDWFRSTFEDGKRDAPPKDLQAVLHVAVKPVTIHGSQHFDIKLFFEYDDDIVAINDNVVLTRKSVYVNNRPVASAPAKAFIGLTPHLGHEIVANVEANRAVLHDVRNGKDLPALQMHVSGMMSYHGRLYVHSGEKIFEVTYIERPSGEILPGTRPVANVMEKASVLFDGVVIQYMLKSYYAVVMPHAGTSYQARLKELEGYKIIDAKFERGVLMVIAAKDGKYDKFSYRFSDNYADYSFAQVKDITYTGVNFTVRDDGMVLHMNHDDDLEVFKSRMDSTGLTTISDSGLQSDARLMHLGTQSMFARGRQLFRFSGKR